MSKIDPINRMAVKANINFNPDAMQVMLRNAATKKAGEEVGS